MNKDDLSKYEVNQVILAGEIYKLPEEIEVGSSGINGLLRRVQIKYDNSCWIFLTFNDIELWSQAKKMKLGQYIKVEGTLSTIFSVNQKKTFSRINVAKILSIQPGENVWISKENLKKLRKKRHPTFVSNG